MVQANKNTNVFLSIGRPLSPEQASFKVALISAIKARGLIPRCVGSRPEDSDVPHARPIDQIRQIIRECDGAVIVAYEKHSADKLRLNSLVVPARELLDAKLSTSWNQAEAAMAYLVDLPLLLISEEGVFGECLLENGVVGSVANVAIHESVIWNEVFQRRMTSWVEDVAARKKKGRIFSIESWDAEEITIEQILRILGGLSWKSAVVLGGGLVALLSLAYSLGASHVFSK